MQRASLVWLPARNILRTEVSFWPARDHLNASVNRTIPRHAPIICTRRLKEVKAYNEP